MDLSVDLRFVRDACTNYFASFKDFYASGTQDAEVTKSLSPPTPPLFQHFALSEKQVLILT